MKVLTTETPAEEAGEHISRLIAAHTGDTLCLLSGGSALTVVEHITEPDEPETQTHRLTDSNKLRTILFAMGDERGSREPSINNYRQLQEQYPNHWVTDCCLATVPEDSESLAEFAARLSQQLDSAIAELHQPQIIYLMGMGHDGHTAGIFPLPEARFAETYQRVLSIVPVRLPGTPVDTSSHESHFSGLRIDSRASVTPDWIKTHVDHVVGYVTGEAKSAMLESLKTETKTVQARPAELWKLKSGTVVYTDQAA